MLLPCCASSLRTASLNPINYCRNLTWKKSDDCECKSPDNSYQRSLYFQLNAADSDFEGWHACAKRHRGRFASSIVCSENMSENLANVFALPSLKQSTTGCGEGKMEDASGDKSQENSSKEERDCEGSSNSNSLSDCQNSSETVTNELENHKSEIKVLANNLEKNLTLNHSVNSWANGIEHCDCVDNGIVYISYKSELQMPDIMRLIQKDLSEPYSIYTYRYFIHNWPKLCFLALHNGECVGAVVCKLDVHRKVIRRGYIAMLAVDQKYRKRKIGSNLVLKAIRAMSADNADEVVLETEITNRPALKLYENLGFVRDKRLFRYYLNGVDALRLKLWLR